MTNEAIFIHITLTFRKQLFSSSEQKTILKQNIKKHRIQKNAPSQEINLRNLTNSEPAHRNNAKRIKARRKGQSKSKDNVLPPTNDYFLKINEKKGRQFGDFTDGNQKIQ